MRIIQRYVLHALMGILLGVLSYIVTDERSSIIIASLGATVIYVTFHELTEHDKNDRA